MSYRVNIPFVVKRAPNRSILRARPQVFGSATELIGSLHAGLKTETD